MSALTIGLFALSASIFLALLAVAVYLFLVDHGQPGSDSEPGTGTDAASEVVHIFSCEVEAVILDEHMQITNLDESQIHLEGTGLGRGLRLVTEDQLQLSLQPGLNQYRLLSMDGGGGQDDGVDRSFLHIRIANDFVEVKPVLKYVKRRLEMIIWKLKPYSVKSALSLAERQVFCGYLQKTVHFARSPGKYFRFLVTTSGPQNRLASFVTQSNMEPQTRKHRLLTLRVQPDRVTATNQSSLPMQVVVRHRAETLKRRLSHETQELPVNGTFSFSLLHVGQGVQKPRKALRLHLSDRHLMVEPHSKFGSLPLSCDVYLPDSAGDSPTQIVSGEFLSALQLPRSSHRYVLAFFLHMSGGSLSLREAPTAAWASSRRQHYFK